LTSFQALARRLELRAADVLGAVEHLPLEVGEVDDVEVDEADVPDAGRGEIQPKRRAEPPGADEQHAGGLELALPAERHVGDDEVTAVPKNLFRGEIREVRPRRS
jgi:hypothetical protein